MGGRASSFKPQDRVSQEYALVKLEPPMCWIDVHCSWDLTRTEKSLDPGIDTCVICSYHFSTGDNLTPVDLAYARLFLGGFLLLCQGPSGLAIPGHLYGRLTRPSFPCLSPTSKEVLASLAHRHRRQIRLLLLWGC